MTLELRLTRYFLAVEDERHFTRAQPSLVSRSGATKLEDQKSRERSRRSALPSIGECAELTTAGVAFFDVVKEMSALTEQATRAAQRAARGKIGSQRPRLTASAAFNTVVPSAVRAFRSIVRYRRRRPTTGLALARRPKRHM